MTWSHARGSRWWGLVLILVGSLGSIAELGAQAESKSGVRESRYRKALVRERKKLSAKHLKVAEWCRKNRLGDQAQEVLFQGKRFDPDNEGITSLLDTDMEHLPKVPYRLQASYEGKRRELARVAASFNSGLAKTAARCGLDDVARRHWEATVEFDPEHRAARKALDHVKFRKAWHPRLHVPLLKESYQPVGDHVWALPELARELETGRFYVGDRLGDAAEADRYHAAWETAWELRTVHFRIRTTLPWAQATLLACEVERTHAQVSGFFGLRDPQETRILHWFNSCEEQKSQYENATDNGWVGYAGGEEVHGHGGPSSFGWLRGRVFAAILYRTRADAFGDPGCWIIRGLWSAYRDLSWDADGTKATFDVARTRELVAKQSRAWLARHGAKALSRLENATVDGIGDELTAWDDTSRAFAVFLVSTESVPKEALGRYLRALLEKGHKKKLFEKCLGKSPDGFIPEFKAWLGSS